MEIAEQFPRCPTPGGEGKNSLEEKENGEPRVEERNKKERGRLSLSLSKKKRSESLRCLYDLLGLY